MKYSFLNLRILLMTERNRASGLEQSLGHSTAFFVLYIYIYIYIYFCTKKNGFRKVPLVSPGLIHLR